MQNKQTNKNICPSTVATVALLAKDNNAFDAPQKVDVVVSFACRVEKCDLITSGDWRRM